MFFDNLREKYPNLRKYSNLDMKKHIISFNRLLARKVLEHIDGVVLPSNMGHVLVCSYKKKRPSIDLQKSDELGKIVRYENHHSEGYTGVAYYTTFIRTKTNRLIRMYENSIYWIFTPDRVFRKGITAEYRTNWKRFRVIGKHKKMQEFVDKENIKTFIKRKVERLKKDYNEFEFD